METKELLAKLKELKELKVLQDEIDDQIGALEDEVKAEMERRNVEKLLVGTYKVSYTKYVSNKFDSTAFKLAHEALYNQYVKQTPARRFTIF